MNYIQEKMAQVGCGASDIHEISEICNGFNKAQKDVLDTWHNNGYGLEMLPEFEPTAQALKAEYDEDTLTCLGAYVAAMRNIAEY